MQTLLIPTDFNTKSVDCIPELTQRYYPEKVNILLVHMMKITDCAQELQILSRRSAEYQHISEEFYTTCTTLKHKYADRINDIRVDFFYGSTVASFKNFLEVNEVDSIIMLENYIYNQLNKDSIQPGILVSRSGVEVINVSCNKAARPDVAKANSMLMEEAL
jgi:hypothetical protein